MKKKFFYFLSIFLLFSILNYLFDYFFRTDDIDLLRNITVAFGVSFGVVFLGGIFNKKKNE